MTNLESILKLQNNPAYNARLNAALKRDGANIESTNQKILIK